MSKKGSSVPVAHLGKLCNVLPCLYSTVFLPCGTRLWKCHPHNGTSRRDSHVGSLIQSFILEVLQKLVSYHRGQK